jgi:hypothetical protein
MWEFVITTDRILITADLADLAILAILAAEEVPRFFFLNDLMMMI